MESAYFFIDQFEMMLKLCVLYSAPIIIGMFLAELGLGLISRFAQQLNVFFRIIKPEIRKCIYFISPLYQYLDLLSF